MLHLETLRQRLDKFDDHGHLFLSVKLLLRMQAVVAGTAVIFVIVLSEITEQQLSAAGIRLGICHCLHQKLFSDLLLGYRLALHELLKFLDVLVTVERNALTFASVSSGASGLLIIAFDALRNVVMDDETHVRLVDSHSKGDGGDNDVDLLHQKLVLILCTCLRIKACVIWRRLYPVDV